MSCHTLQDAIVDVARGRDVGAGTVGAVEAHIEHCTSCRARFTREQHLSEGLRALARSTDSHGASSIVEMRLLAEFKEHSTVARGALRWTRRSLGEGGRTAKRSWWMRTAAAIALLAASAVAWWWMANQSRVEDVRSASIAAPNPPESKTPPPQVSEARTSDPSVPSPVVSHEPRRRPTTASRPPASRIVRPEGFVALPSAEGLPAFESGEIVRVEVPVTSLPMYGIDIAPDARGSAVEADFLVGQDGQARAIRLVRNGRL